MAVRAGERTYSRNEVIYREGDPSDAVYVVVTGKVELYRDDPDGRVSLGRVGPIEMFGETDILTGGPREASARALQKTRVRMVPQHEFSVWLQNEPNAGLRVMGLLVERLRMADAIIARERDGVPLMASSGLGGLFESFMDWLRWRRGPLARRNAAAAGQGGVTKPFQIAIAMLNNDIEGAWTRALAGMLEGTPGIEIREFPQSLQLDPGAEQTQALAALVKARQLLARDDGFDLLVWGDVHSEGYSLWLTPAGQADDDRPGGLSVYRPLELAPDQESPVPEMFYLACISALEPVSEPQRQSQYQLLANAYQAMPSFPDELPGNWNNEQQRTALTVMAHTLASLGAFSGDAGWFPMAVEAYNEAIARLSPEETGIEEAMLRKNLAAALLSGDNQEPQMLEYALEQYRAAVDCIVRATHPLEWGAAQNRLGVALYKVDLATGQPALLKEAMSCYQQALQVFTKVESPLRWADVMNNLAQALQIYGDQAKNPEILQRAVEACRAALEFRSRERNPLGWAASQNTLGTALFLLDKHKRSTEHLEEAAAAYQGALEVFRQMGAQRLGQVAEKNLAHVLKLTKIRGDRPLAMPD